MKHGFLLVDKPLGFSSHDVVAKVRKALFERKVGHLGTLDPAATGLMVLAVGTKALKTIELFEKADKTYEVTLRFGETSSTYDSEGVREVVTPPLGFVEPTQAAIEQCIAQHFNGVIVQQPPQHSAIHVDGVRAYQLARQGIEVTMPKRTVAIHSCTVLSYTYPELTLRIACSSGTYIRSFAHDLGQLLRCGAYVTQLRRTHLGSWSVEFAIPIDVIGWSYVQPLREVLDCFSQYILTDEEWQKVQHGQYIPANVTYPTIAWHNEYPVALLEPKDSVFAKARKVF